MTFGFAHELIEQFGTFDVEEVRGRTGLLAERMGDGLRDHRLAGPWRAIQQDPAWGFEAVRFELLAMDERQFNRVTHLRDLLIQATDHLVRRLRYLSQLQTRGPRIHRDRRERHVRLGVHEHELTRPHTASRQSLRRPDDNPLPRPHRHNKPIGIKRVDHRHHGTGLPLAKNRHDDE